jgi:hypothetical protein
LKILHNHIGYETTGPKHAVVTGGSGDTCTTFTILDYATGKAVYSGQVYDAGPVERWRDWHFWTLDFDTLQTEGIYQIECHSSQGILHSFPFAIHNQLLERHTLSDVLAYFKGQRASGLLNKADQALPFAGDPPNLASRVVNAAGGWYDATGDYGKHLSHLCFSTYFNPQQIPLTVWSLLKSYTALRDQRNPDFAEYLRRALDEAMFGADYLTRVKSSTGSFYISVSAHGPAKLPEDRRIARVMRGFEPGSMEKTHEVAAATSYPESDYWCSYRSGGGVAIAALALASTFTTGGEFENSQYLKAAETAFAFLEENNLSLVNDGQENIVDDYCALLAATELFRATGKADYQTAASKRAQSLTGRLATSGEYANYWRADAHYRPFFHASDGGLPVVSLLNYFDLADNVTQTQILDTVKKSLEFALEITAEVNNPFGYSRQLVQDKTGARKTTFFFPHNTEVAPWWQGENARLSSMATAARMAAPHFKHDSEFYNRLQAFGWNQLNWILGLNPFDMCMLDGSGHNNPPYLIQMGSYQYSNAPGGICNGITSGLEDESGIAFHIPPDGSGVDDNWRWGEQWLPHAAWYLLAVSVHNQ